MPTRKYTEIGNIYIKGIISISMMREIPHLIESWDAGSCPSEAHCGRRARRKMLVNMAHGKGDP